MNITYSFFITFLAGFATMLGIIVIFLPSNNKNKIISSSLSFASGVMICVSLTDLIPESLTMLTTKYNYIESILIFLVFLCVGIISSMSIDKYMPENKENDSKLFRVGIISMLAIILHNIPEGIATFMASSINTKLGISLAIAIAMHNIPEGISISVPIFYSTKSKRKAFLYTLISALSEPFGALLAFLFLRRFITNSFMGILFAFIAGIMMYISIYELLKEAKQYKEKTLSSIFFVIGIIFMFINHFLF